MDDVKIVELYWQRSERAIDETVKKFGAYLHKIAMNILANREDAEECVNDTYVGAWNSMPDNRPARLSPYLGRIVRNAALDRVLSDTRLKRGGGEVPLALDELFDVASRDDTELSFQLRELVGEINAFLATLGDTERRVFVARYFFLMPVNEIAEKQGFTRSKTASMLSRTRKAMRLTLEKEGYI